MQSLLVLRLLLNAAAFALALTAASRRAWSVVEPPVGVGRWTAPDASSGNSSITSSSDIVRLTFSPNEYCMVAGNGSSDCHAYAYMLTLSDQDLPVLNLTALTTGGFSDDEVQAPTSSRRLEAAASSWCVAAPTPSISTTSGSDQNNSWLLQGAQSMLCLVVLETCLYSTSLWQLLGFCSVFYALATLLKKSAFEAGAGFSTLAQAALGALVIVEWAGYAMYMLDLGYLAVLQLVVHYGASFRLALLSTLFSCLSCHVSSKISSPFSTIHLAKLHALPTSPRSSSQQRQWSPQSAGSPLSPDNPEIESEDATLDCLEQAIDPLKCPANYRT